MSDRATAPRPRQHLIAAGELYPGAWRTFDGFRTERGKSLPDWPGWCYVPMAAAYAVVSGGGENRVPLQIIGDVSRLAALAAWRPTQGIYRFDDDLRRSLMATPLDGDLPCESLYRLPEWCVYCETPGAVLDGPVYGFFAHLESDANSGREELRMLLDAQAGLIPIPIHLGTWSLQEAVARAIDVAKVHATAFGIGMPTGIQNDITALVGPLLSLLLYLCADEAEVGDGVSRPSHPAPTRTKTGWRLFPPKEPRVWEVGARLGASLRQARSAPVATDPDSQTSRARPHPHIRRAHWHTFLAGPGRTERRIKWLPPLPVNVGSGTRP